VITPSGSREIVSALVQGEGSEGADHHRDTRVDAKGPGDAGVKTETLSARTNYAGGKLAGEYL